MHLGELCKRSVVTCRRDASARELARLMREHHVGDVVVVDEREGLLTPVGVVTDRDLVVQVLAMDIDPAVSRAEDLMTKDVATAFDSELVYDAIWHMRGKSIRRLPIVDAHNHLLGILTADDVTRFLAQELSDMTLVATRQIEHEGASTFTTESHLADRRTGATFEQSAPQAVFEGTVRARCSTNTDG